MLGTDGRLYDRFYDFNRDGKLDMYELSIMDDDIHRSLGDEEDDELEDLEYLDSDERQKALEEMGYDPDDYDDSDF